MIEQLPRLIFVGFTLYALVVLVTRWPATRVMTQDRRFLFLFFVLETVTVLVSGCLKISHETRIDIGTWLTVLTQSFLAAYLHYSIPPAYRRAHHRFTRRRPRKEV